jgi:Bacterial Ig-like domain (group 3)
VSRARRGTHLPFGMGCDPVNRNGLGVLAFTALIMGGALAAAAVPATASPRAAMAATLATSPTPPTPPTGHWGNAHTVGGLNNANDGGVADVSSVSCGSPGNCVAVGTFRSSDHNSHNFMAEEHGGTWGQPGGLLPLMVTTFDSVSCSDADNCVAIGHEIDSAPHPFFDVKAHGVWGGAVPLDANGTRGEPISVSCVPASPGNCAIGGWVDDTSGLAQPFTKGENNNTWAPLQQVTALQFINAGIDAQVNSMSCQAPGSCTGVGFVKTSGGSYRPFITEEAGGQWTFGFPVPELSRVTTNSAQATEVSCATAGDCALAGPYTDGHGNQQVFVIDKVNGDWILPQPVPGLADLNVGGFAEVTGISCGSPGNCVVTGDYEPDTHNSTAGFVAEEKNGQWQPARPVVGTATNSFGIPVGSADAVSCVSAGNCVVGGSISVGNGEQAAVLREVNGSWGKPTAVPGMAALSNRVSADVNTVSCASVGNCAIGGIYQDSHGFLQAFLADESTATSTSLKLSAAKIRFGHEQGEKLSVKVKPRRGGTPSGTVTVLAGRTKLCVIKLTHGTGSCALSAKKLKPGSYRLTGVYSGDRHYDGSSYPAKTLTVTKP